MPTKFSVSPGDRVAYSVWFLASIGMSHSEMAHAKGRVVEVKGVGPLELAIIEWEGNSNLPPKVAVPNLAKVGPNMRYCNCG